MDSHEVNFPQTSTPVKDSGTTTHKLPPIKIRKHGLKGIIINCNGIKSVNKQADFCAILEQHQPDLLLGCESKLNNNITTYEAFPENYTVYRKDHNINGGGVFVATCTKDSIILSEEPTLDSDCEIMWTTYTCSIQFGNSKPLLVASYYNPNKSDIKSLDNICSHLLKNVSQKNKCQYPNVIIGGDYNLPDINWTDWTPNNTKTKSYPEKFLNFLVENSLSQLQTKITRPISNSVVDLLVTTNPNIIENMQVVPGLSDHLVVLFDVCMKPKSQKKPQRKMYMFDKAD